MSAVRSWKLGEPIVVPDHYGDTFAPALADDGRVYSPSNDTVAFGVPEFFTRDQVRLKESDFPAFAAGLTKEQLQELDPRPLGFERLEGDAPAHIRGTTVNRMPDYRDADGVSLADPTATPRRPDLPGSTWKSSGCTFVDGALYWVVARHGFDPYPPADPGSRHPRQWARDASIIRSTDYGRTWFRDEAANEDEPMFPDRTFPTPFFVDFAGAVADGSDRWVYAASNDGYWDNGDTMILGRVSRDRIARLDAADWQYYRGGDGGRDDAWTHDSAAAVPILDAYGRLGETGATYLPHRDRYVMIGWFYPSGGGHHDADSSTTQWDLYESPKPWGPWTRVASHTWSPQGYYVPIVYPTFRDGDSMYVATSGNFKNWYDHYHLTLVPAELS